MNIRDLSNAEKPLISIALFSYPVLVLCVRHVMSFCLVFLVAICLQLLYRDLKRSQIPNRQVWDHHSIAFSLAMVSPTFAVVLNQIYHFEFYGNPYDETLRFLLAIPIFMGLRYANIDVIKIYKFAFPLGTLVTFLWVIIYNEYDEINRIRTYFLDAIHFGDIALILGMLSLFSVRFDLDNPLPLTILQFAGFMIGLYLSVLSGSRGGWVAVPVLLLIWSYYKSKEWPRKKAFVLMILLVWVFSAGVFLNIDIASSRTNEIYQDVRAFLQAEKDTSMGLRMQIWGAAAQLFLKNPLFGLGPEGYREQITQLGEAGEITSMAVTYGIAEVHQQLLNYAVKFGLVGLLSILAVHLVPLVVFVRSAKESEASRNQAGILGVCTVIGFLIFGLTVEIFNLKMIVTFYSVTVAVLLSAATKNEGLAKIESIELKMA